MAYLGGCIPVRLEIIADAWPRLLSIDGDEIGNLQPGGCQRSLYIRRAPGAARIVPRHVQNDADRRKRGQTRDDPCSGAIRRGRRRLGQYRRRRCVNVLIRGSARRGWRSGIWRQGRSISIACCTELLCRKCGGAIRRGRRRLGQYRRRRSVNVLVRGSTRRGWRSGIWRQGRSISIACRPELLRRRCGGTIRRGRRRLGQYRRRRCVNVLIRRSARRGWRSGIWRQGRSISIACRAELLCRRCGGALRRGRRRASAKL